MQKDNLHFGGIEHRDLHNLHGLLFHRATALGLQERGASLYPGEGDRPFVLTRAFYAGSQRWGPMWTGDNTASWDSLRVTAPMLLASGLAGYPWAGTLLPLLPRLPAARARPLPLHAPQMALTLHVPRVTASTVSVWRSRLDSTAESRPSVSVLQITKSHSYKGGQWNARQG